MKIGIDIGGSHVGVGLVDNVGNILLKYEKDLVQLKQEAQAINDEKYKIEANDRSKQNKIEVNGGIEQNKANDRIKQNNIEDIIINAIVEFIKRILTETSIPIRSIDKIGIASPGNVQNEIIISASNLGLKNFNIVEKLKEYYDIPITLRNDAKCAGVAENKFGVLKKYDNSVFLTVGTGIGGAVFWNGELLEPKQLPGFEVGHMIIAKNGKLCKCGHRGCFEKYASISALKEQVVEKYELTEELTGLELYNFIMKNEQEEKMQSIINEYVNNLAIGIANLVNIFQPEVVCLGGSFAYYEKLFLPKLEQVIGQYWFCADMAPELVIAKNKNDAGIIGA